MKRDENFEIKLEEVQEEQNTDGVIPVRLVTDQGTIECRLHETRTCQGAVIWVGGAGGGLEGPAGGLYPRLAEILTRDEIRSLRLAYRHPNDLIDCTIDTLLGIAYMTESQKCDQIVLVGHSFGGAVVIRAGALSRAVVGVAVLSSQTYGTEDAGDLSPRALLCIHGTDDQVLPDWCAKDIYQRAKDPKEIILYPGCRHGLDECRDQLDRDLLRWIRGVLLRDPASLGS